MMRIAIVMVLRALLLLSIVSQISQPARARAEQLLWHEVRLDSSGQIISWVDSPAPYDVVLRRAWDAFKNIPIQPNGYRTYFAYPTFYGPNDPQHPEFSGRDWVHHPAGLFAMMADSAILYYAYSGDRIVIERVKEMLDHMIEHGSTRSDFAWSSVPYACSDAGNLSYQGATDTRYCFQENHTSCGRGDGVGFLEPDKVGELGLAYLRFYEISRKKKYLRAALRCADALTRHVHRGDESHSPWPFRVDAETGVLVREQYCANTIGPIRLFDELIRLRLGHWTDYQRVRNLAWHWLMTYPVQNEVWTQYFEDVPICPDYRVNLNQYCALETARYLLQRPECDTLAIEHARRILDWVTAFFAADSKTMAGLPEKGRQWGAEVLSEQVNDMDKMSSHTARYASVRALLYEVTNDPEAKERAFRSFNWSTYAARENGLIKSSLDEGTGYWFSDGYGDYLRHFQRGMASVPEWAPATEPHLLGSSSVIRSVEYGRGKIVYTTFDASAKEILRLSRAPKNVWAGDHRLSLVTNLAACEEGYGVEPASTGGCILRIKHAHSADVRIIYDSAGQ